MYSRLIELNEEQEEERKAEQTKNELIINMSHDLHTPLTSVLGIWDLLSRIVNII